MDYLLLVFKFVSVTFALAAVYTGAQATLDPVGFSKSFGLPLNTTSTPRSDGTTRSWISLMGVRQLATGLTLLIFAYQSKWTEMATILSLIGILVAGTDGFHLSRAGERQEARYHAIPGALIAMLAGAVVYRGG